MVGWMDILTALRTDSAAEKCVKPYNEDAITARQQDANYGKKRWRACRFRDLRDLTASVTFELSRF